MGPQDFSWFRYFQKISTSRKIFLEEIKLVSKVERSIPHCVKTCSYILLMMHRVCKVVFEFAATAMATIVDPAVYTAM